MKIRFAVPITLASALAFLAAVSLAPAASAQRPGEHRDNVHANGSHIPEAPARREVHAKPEIDRRSPADVSTAFPTFTITTGTVTIVRATSASLSRIPIRMAASNTLARPTAITWNASIRARTACGSPAASLLRSLRGIGTSPPVGAGIVRATTLSSTVTPIIPAGISSTTPKPASMSTPNTWARNLAPIRAKKGRSTRPFLCRRT
jgi:hypothetical protein